ncbi:protein phosphatase 1 regulatory subunit 1B-like isoform X2 [Xyrauchen texanus]|uniref:protein phosphatase 1 regulatory subunit 1B-like isoform X2 n=1 Tax=Xyrauchen texanus TaxID=154827 RepID=UPI0022422A75|nr:protein phosphatase 1 regulatory subunit 1B-like isoform X2 [Xyrauchen texanus]
MEPSSHAEMEPKERRKIHFAVPATEPTQLDPRQVEMIRRRRPTPATLFKVSDQTTTEDDNSTHQWVVGENGVLKPKLINPNIYQPPSLKAVQQMAEAQMLKLGVYPHVEEEGEEPILREEEELSSSHTPELLPLKIHRSKWAWRITNRESERQAPQSRLMKTRSC